MEASAVCLPVIVSNVPGCRQVVDNFVTGLYCKPSDSEDLAKKMLIIANMKQDERQEMGSNGRKKMIKEYDESIVINQYLDILNKILFA